MVSRSIVKNQVNGSTLAMLELGSEELEEGHKVLTVGAFGQHEERPMELLANGANHSDAVASVLVQDYLHWLISIHPGRPHLDPHVERRLVSVNDYRLLLDSLS